MLTCPNPEVVALLLQKFRVYHSNTTDHGETPLILAAKNGHAKVVQLLLDAGASALTEGGAWLHAPVKASAHHSIADKDMSRGSGPTAVYFAVAKGHVEILSTLLSTQPGSSSKFSQVDMQELLKWAAMYGHMECAKLLIRHGADIHDREGEYTALHLAAYFDHAEVISLLLDEGANPEQTTLREGLTALHIAAMEGSTEALATLIDGRWRFDIESNRTILVKSDIDTRVRTTILTHGQGYWASEIIGAPAWALEF